MDIHKPKPWHSVRELLKEIGTIVIGVLIALGGEQAVEWAHWQHEVHVAREAIAFDLREIVARAASKDAESHCVAQRLGEMADILDQAQATHRLPPYGLTGAPDTPPWVMRSWSGLTSGQTLAHMPNREQILLSGLALYLGAMAQNTASEQQEWAALSTMIGPGRPTSDAEIAMLRIALGHAHNHAVFEKVGSQQVASLVARTGYLSRAQLDDAFRIGLARAKTMRICQPQEPPLGRSSAFFHNFLDRPVAPPTEEASRALAIGNAGAVTTER